MGAEKQKQRRKDHEQHGLLSRINKIGLLTLNVLWGAVLTAVLTATILRYDLLDFIGNPPTIEAQLDEIRRDIASENLHPIASHKIDFHGSGTENYMLILRANDLDSQDPKKIYAAPSDVIRIYEVADGEVHLVFAFAPEGSTNPSVFRVAEISDFDGDGDEELIGAYWSLGMEPIDPLPVLLQWHPKDGYDLSALLTTPAELGRPKGLYARVSHKRYGEGVSLTSVDDRTESLDGYTAENFSVYRGTDGLMLLADYVSRAPTHAAVRQLEIQGYLLNGFGTTLRASWCRSTTRFHIPVKATRSTPNYLEASWKRLASRGCY